MLWPTLINCKPANDADSFHCAAIESPYAFSIAIVHDQARERNHGGLPYDFEINGSNNKHIIQIGFSSGEMRSIDGLIVRRDDCKFFDSPFTDLGEALEQASLFTLAPMNIGITPQCSGATIVQKTRISINVYRDAIIIWFEDFNSATSLQVAPSFDVAIDKNGNLAALIFRDYLANHIVAGIQTQ